MFLYSIHEECVDGKKFIHCHPTDTDFCIAEDFQSDGINNCPPPFTSDEPMKKKSVEQQVFDGSNENTPSNKNHAAFISIKSNIFYVMAIVTIKSIFFC